MSPWLDTRIAFSTFFYFSSAAFKALCHMFVRKYGRDIEENFLDPELVESQQSQAATVAG
jgi:hypothetical protein